MATEETTLRDEIKSRAEKLEKATPWDSAVLAREIAERAALLRNLKEEDSSVAEEIGRTAALVR